MHSWSSLPNELVTLIGDCLDNRFDVLRFRAVCTSWRSSIPHSHNIFPYFSIKLPYPIFSYPTSPMPVRDHPSHIHTTSFFTLTEITTYRLEPIDQVKSPNYSGGIVMKLEEFEPGKLRLLNPLSHHQIRYSPKTFPRTLNLLNYRVFELGKVYRLKRVQVYGCSSKITYYDDVDKALLSADNSALLVIHEGYLALLRFGDDKWTRLGETWTSNQYTDIMLYKGQFHAVGSWGQIEVVDSVTLKLTKVWRRLDINGSIFHFLNSSSGLYVVNRHLDSDHRVVIGYDENSSKEYCYYMRGRHGTNKTVYFDIYKLNETECDWVEVETLVDQVMFLGDDCSFLSLAEELSGCRGNSIYFSHNFFCLLPKGLDGHDTAMFNLEDRSIRGLASVPDNFQVI